MDVELHQGQGGDEEDIFETTKSLRYLPELRKFCRYYEIENRGAHLPKEMWISEHAVSRLRKFRNMTFGQAPKDTTGLQSVLKSGKKHPRITHLFMQLAPDPLENYGFGGRVFKSEREGPRPDESLLRFGPGQEISEDDLAIFPDNLGQSGEEISPFFRYDLFPNLRIFVLMLKDWRYPLQNFVEKGFKNLQNLKELRIYIRVRPIGTRFIFQGFEYLPLLKEFSLQIEFIRLNEWKILEQFLEKQNDLESFKLGVCSGYFSNYKLLVQNPCLEQAISKLNNKPRLRDLSLRSPYWSLSALGNGLKKLHTVNKLACLELQGHHDPHPFVKGGEFGIQGLCEFLKRQKGHLKKLQANLSFVLDEEIMNSVLSAISEIEGLKDLKISINRMSTWGFDNLAWHYSGKTQFWEYPSPKLPKVWNPKVAKTLKNLKNLDSFHLAFDITDKKDADSVKWIFDIIQMLSRLGKLRSLNIETDSWRALERSEDFGVMVDFNSLWNIREIVVHEGMSSSFGDKIWAVNRRQASRSDLMF